MTTLAKYQNAKTKKDKIKYALQYADESLKKKQASKVDRDEWFRKLIKPILKNAHYQITFETYKLGRSKDITQAEFQKCELKKSQHICFKRIELEDTEKLFYKYGSAAYDGQNESLPLRFDYIDHMDIDFNGMEVNTKDIGMTSRLFIDVDNYKATLSRVKLWIAKSQFIEFDINITFPEQCEGLYETMYEKHCGDLDYGEVFEDPTAKYTMMHLNCIKPIPYVDVQNFKVEMY